MHAVRYLWQIKIVSPTSYLRLNGDKVPWLVEIVCGERGNSAQCYSKPVADRKRSRGSVDPAKVSVCIYIINIYLHNVSLQMMPR